MTHIAIADNYLQISYHFLSELNVISYEEFLNQIYCDTLQTKKKCR